MSKQRTAALLTGAAVGAGAALAYYSLRVEPLSVELTCHELSPGRLPDAWDGLRILFLADTHCWGWTRREERVLELLDTIETPDLVIWGGDFLGGGEAIHTSLRLARAVAERFPGVPAFTVRGNAEHKIDIERRDDLERRLAETGVETLVNRWRDLTLRGETVTLAGVDDPYYGFCDLEATLADAPSDRFALLVAHSPQILTRAARAGVDLMLSGHTHGGQVRLPGFGALKTQNPLSRRIDCGVFYRERVAALLGRDPGGDLVTFISRGIGLAFVPRLPWAAPRFNCRPEVAVLTLRKAQRSRAENL